MFKLVKRLYELNIMTNERLKWYVVNNKISNDQYKEITGIEYTTEPEEEEENNNNTDNKNTTNND